MLALMPDAHTTLTIPDAPIFAVSRVSGWTARVLEYLADNRLFRPRGIYVGPAKADYVAISDR